jgi:EAL domain-containing protein (putative c-di-GMP-specific phosphodiesterase class I)
MRSGGAMVDLRKKKLSRKATILLLIVIMVSSVLSVLFGYLYINEVREEFYSTFGENAQFVANDIYSSFSEADAVLALVDMPEDIRQEYYAYADAFLFVRLDSTARMYTKNDPYPNEGLIFVTALMSVFNEGIQSSGSPMYRDLRTINYLFNNYPTVNNEGMYFAAKLTDEGYVLVLRYMGGIFEKMDTYGFSNFRVVSRDFTYSCSNLDPQLNDHFYSAVSLEAKQRFAESQTFTGQITIDDNRYILSLTGQTGPYGVLRIAALETTDALDQRVRLVRLRMLVENISLITLFSIGFLFLVFILMKDEGTFQFFNIRNGNYAIKVNPTGKILWQNFNFQNRFDIKNISSAVQTGDKKLSVLLASCQPLILDIDDRDGEKHNLLMSVIRFGRIYRLVGSDLTPEISAYRSLSHADMHDALTDLQQEWVFVNRVASIVGQGKGLKGALALIRLSNLSMLKIMLGEHLYKQVLMLYSANLRREFEGMGELYILKNGDYLLFNNDNSGNLLVSKLPFIMEKLRLPLRLNDNNIQLDAKIGLIILNSRDNNITANSLLSNAQRALEYAINSVKQNYYILYPTSFSTSRTNFRADGVVKMMIQNGEIEAYFQAQYSLVTNRIVGFEALTRIVGPKSSEITVAELISIAEQYGGMIDLGNFICDKAMDFCEEIMDSGLQIAVNVSPIQLMQAGFTNTFIEMFRKHKLKEGVFNIEITEGAALYSFDEAVAKLSILRNNGIGIHIDDFGVAYSSMLHLKLLPATLIKIDKSLIDDITESADARAIIKNIISLAIDLRLEVIAEGVEKSSQAEVLRELQCHMVQGYYVSKAVPRLRALELIKEFNKE